MRGTGPSSISNTADMNELMVKRINKNLAYFRNTVAISFLFLLFTKFIHETIFKIRISLETGIINNVPALATPSYMEKQYRNPAPTVDVILQRESKVLMVRRKKDPFKGQLALPGGFINEGETAEQAAKREAMEETSLEVEPIDILGVYSDPRRDPRKHVMSTVFICIVVGGQDRAGDDAASLEWIELADVERQQVAFDHVTILRDYKQWKASGGTFWSAKRRGRND